MLWGASGSQMRGLGKRVVLLLVGWVRSKATQWFKGWKATPAMDLLLRLQQLFQLAAEQKSSVLCHFDGAYSLEYVASVRQWGSAANKGAQQQEYASAVPSNESKDDWHSSVICVQNMNKTNWLSANVLQSSSRFVVVVVSSKRDSYHLDDKVCWHLLDWREQNNTRRITADTLRLWQRISH